MRTGQSRYGEGQMLSVPAVRKDGAQISVEFTIIPFASETGQMIGIAAIMRDTTARFEELRTLRRQLASLSAQRSRSASQGADQTPEAPATNRSAPRPSISIFPLFYSGSIGPFGDEARRGWPRGAASPPVNAPSLVHFGRVAMTASLRVSAWIIP